MLDGERMQRANDPHQQHEPEQQAADGEEQCRHQQPEMELRDDSQASLTGLCTTTAQPAFGNGNSTEKPVLTIGPWPRL